MVKAAVAAAQFLMRLSPSIGLGGVGANFGSTRDQLSQPDPAIRFRQAMFEKAGIDEFYSCFPDLDDLISGKDVLDFGCGYGGKAVEFAKVAKSVTGIEPLENHIELANRYASHVGSANVSFCLCAQDSIPFPDHSFDVVVSHDVLEHVANPEISIGEIHRVLRPGGMALIAFPPYDGARSHHLDYVTRLPGLHWIFEPSTLVRAANREIHRQGLATPPQHAAAWSWDGERRVLPGLNGLGRKQFDKLLEVAFGRFERVTTYVGEGRWPIARKIGAVLKSDRLISGLRYRAYKPEDACEPLQLQRPSTKIAPVTHACPNASAGRRYLAGRSDV